LTTLAQQTPTFRGGADSVTVTFTALTDDGTPIANLTARDLTLTVDGRARAIETLEFVRVATTDAFEEGTRARQPPPLPMPFASNRPSDAGRTVLFVVHGTGDRHLVALSAANRFLDLLGPRDRASVATLPTGQILVPLTTNLSRVREALPRAGHFGPPAGGKCVDLQALGDLLDSVTGLPGPKSIVLMSEGVSGSDNCAADFYEVVDAVGAAAVQLFVIQPLRMDGAAERRTSSGTSVGYSRPNPSLEDLAGASGGEFFLPAGTADPIMRRVGRSSAAHYVLSFAATSQERDGKRHRIALTTTRPGVTIRARPDFRIAPPPKPGSAAAKAATVPETTTALAIDRRGYDEVPLRAMAYVGRGPDAAHVKLVVVAEPASSTTSIGSMSVAAIGAKGVYTSWDAAPGDLARSPAVTAALIAPGEYRLRVAVRDGARRAGTVDHEIVAGLDRIGPWTAGMFMTGVDGDRGFTPRLQLVEEPRMAAYFELYGAAAPQPTIVFELAATPDGPVLREAVATISGDREPERWNVTGALSIADLDPGDYALRARVHVGGSAVGVLMKTVRIGAPRGSASTHRESGSVGNGRRESTFTQPARTR
jgi:VWFA-related protein